YLVPNATASDWDTLYYGDPALGPFTLDPSRDNFARYHHIKDSLKNRSKVNGTEGDEGRLTREDVNYNGWSTRERFFRATIDFDDAENSPYYDPNANSAQPGVWRRFRIPLQDNPYFDTVYATGGTAPSWSEIRFVRLWWEEFPDQKKSDSLLMEFAAIEFVGNQWQPRLTGDSIKIEASVLNTEDDPQLYNSLTMPPALVWELREEGSRDFLKKEQALRLKYRSLERGEEALAERFFTYQNINLSHYEEIRMFVRMHTDPAAFEQVNEHTWFVYRFGLNDSTYYEYRERFGAPGTNSLRDRGWIEGIRINLRDIAQLKGSLSEQFDSASVVRVLPNGAQYRLFTRTGIAPSFSDVKWMAMGVLRDQNNPSDLARLDSGDVWINGLRVSGIRALRGNAFRGDFTTQWADFMNVSLNANYEDADFRQMSEDFDSPRDSRVGGGLSAQWSLDKFIPSHHGFSVPLSTSVTGTLTRPKIQPGSDIHLTHDDDRPDRLSHMAKDFAELIVGTELDDIETKAEHWEQTTVNRTVSTSYSKSPTSDNRLVDLTAERVTTSASYGRDTTTTHKGQRDDPDLPDHMKTTSKRTYRGELGYDLSPRKPPDWTKWEPFADAKAERLPRQMKQYELTFLPATLNFDLVDAEYSRYYEHDTRTLTTLSEKKLGMDHGFQTKFRPIKPLLDIDFDWSIVRKFDEDVQDWEGSWRRFAEDKVFALDSTWHEYLIVHAEKKRTQRFGLRLNPQFVDWLTHSADYDANYNQYPQNRSNDSTDYLNTNVVSKFGFRSGLRIRTLLGDLSGATEKLKGLSRTIEAMETGLSKVSLNDFNFSYNASLDLKNEYFDTSFLARKSIGRADFFTYQLGKEGRSFRDIVTGDMDDKDAFGGVRYRLGYPRQDSLGLYQNDLRTTNQDWKTSTSMRFPEPLDLSFNTISLGWRRRYTHKPDTGFIDTTVTWPEIRVGASSRILERVTFLKQLMRNMDLSSTYSFAKDSALSSDKEDITRKHGWAPLISFRGTVKRWPISTAYSHDFTYDTTSSRSRAGGDTLGTRKTEHTNTADVGYKIRATRRSEIKIFRWVIPIKGELDMGVEAKHKHAKQKRDDEAKERDRTELSLEPHVSYYFTENVKGELRYLGERIEDEYEKEETVNHALTLTVRINF
ncbi:MAG: cell surface protein SprA, partial [Chitinivibrionales bacterium]|nr:cell surface protein SprA [Chitinivibrionales bacterium]MBD3394689.1 cell surface protein SprA [Chitinivibrionales bacterium]